MALAIGNFDGLHLGHLSLLEMVKHLGKTLNIEQNVLSFSPHPKLGPYPSETECSVKQKSSFLTTLEDQKILFQNQDVNTLFRQAFSSEFASLTPEQFVHDFLHKMLGVKHIVVGENYRFGASRCGDTHTLARIAEPLGIECHTVPPVSLNNKTVSSTRIRESLERGDVTHAGEMLGRPYTIKGIVNEGDKRGRTIGFPTLNISSIKTLIPKDGVYVGQFQFTDTASSTKDNPCVIHIGPRPTVDSEQFQPSDLEVHILSDSWESNGIDHDYERPIHLSFLNQIRKTETFDSLESLKSQIAKDVEFAHAWFKEQ